MVQQSERRMDELSKPLQGDNQPLQTLTFVLDGALFGANIKQIQEVLEYVTVTRVPKTPKYMLGVINLRGNVLPVVDLRRLFGMRLSEPTVDTCVVIVEVPYGDSVTTVGVLADAVHEVTVFDQDSVRNPPKVGLPIDETYIDCMGKIEEKLVIILDIEKVFSEANLLDYVDAHADSDMADGQAQQHG